MLKILNEKCLVSVCTGSAPACWLRSQICRAGCSTSSKPPQQCLLQVPALPLLQVPALPLLQNPAQLLPSSRARSGTAAPPLATDQPAGTLSSPAANAGLSPAQTICIAHYVGCTSTGLSPSVFVNHLEPVPLSEGFWPHCKHLLGDFAPMIRHRAVIKICWLYR